MTSEFESIFEEYNQVDDFYESIEVWMCSECGDISCEEYHFCKE